MANWFAEGTELMRHHLNSNTICVKNKNIKSKNKNYSKEEKEKVLIVRS